jgi:hypothetical protein
MTSLSDHCPGSRCYDGREQDPFDGFGAVVVVCGVILLLMAYVAAKLSDRF